MARSVRDELYDSLNELHGAKRALDEILAELNELQRSASKAGATDAIQFLFQAKLHVKQGRDEITRKQSELKSALIVST